MENKLKWKEPNDVAFLETVKAINELDAVRTSLDIESLGMTSLCCPYIPPMVSILDSLIELTAVSLGFKRTSENGKIKFEKGSLLADDFFEIDKDEFIDMIYRCRYDTVMLHSIYNCFANHCEEDIAAVAKHFKFYS